LFFAATSSKWLGLLPATKTGWPMETTRPLTSNSTGPLTRMPEARSTSASSLVCSTRPRESTKVAESMESERVTSLWWTTAQEMGLPGPY
jgi:hypothetical protein